MLFSSEFCEISKNTFSYRTPPVAASEWISSCMATYYSNLVKSSRVNIEIEQCDNAVSITLNYLRTMKSRDVLNSFFIRSVPYTAQKLKFSIKGFFSKCDQIRRKQRVWSHLLKKSLTLSWRFLYDNGLRHKRVNGKLHFLCSVNYACEVQIYVYVAYKK